MPKPCSTCHEMAPVEAARGISIVFAECGRCLVRLHNERGEVFAYASLDGDGAADTFGKAVSTLTDLAVGRARIEQQVGHA